MDIIKFLEPWNQQGCHLTDSLSKQESRKNLLSLHIVHRAISPGGEEHEGIKPTVTPWPLEAHSYIAILHACALTFSNPSLKVACSWVCGLRRLCRSSRLSECSPALHRVTYKAIVLKEPYLSLLSTPICSTCCRENITLRKLKCSSTQHFEKLFRHGRLVGPLKRKPITWPLWKVKMVFSSHWKFNQSVICLRRAIWNTGPS